ncbi:MAG: L-threonylcarbamoyladenylate synthase [Actinomycetota bacterium]|nr:L-threonylcarbamoyladenylate synthase [Actinomycetota bacterium]
MTVILDAAGDAPPATALARAVEALRAGEVVIVPTDTVYGLAVDPRKTGVLFALKHRPLEVALPVLVADVEQALALAADGLAPAVQRLMGRWWPGGLTLVVPRRRGLDLDLGGPDDTTIGLRLPDHPVPVALAEAVGPLAVTSANRHGQATPATAAAVVDQLGPGVGLALDAGPCDAAPSTVVAWTGGELRVLREGAVDSGEILADP